MFRKKDRRAIFNFYREVKEIWNSEISKKELKKHK